MHDVSVANWTGLVTARLEADQAEVRVDDAIRCLPAGVRAEKTMVTELLEAAFVRMRAAKRALTVAELAASPPHRVE